MKLILQKIKFYLSLICIGLIALLGIPAMPKENIEKIIQANIQNMASDVIQAEDEQS
jgi:hypothetical protein